MALELHTVDFSRVKCNSGLTVENEQKNITSADISYKDPQTNNKKKMFVLCKNVECVVVNSQVQLKLGSDEYVNFFESIDKKILELGVERYNKSGWWKESGIDVEEVDDLLKSCISSKGMQHVVKMKMGKKFQVFDTKKRSVELPDAESNEQLVLDAADVEFKVAKIVLKSNRNFQVLFEARSVTECVCDGEYSDSDYVPSDDDDDSK